AARRAEHLGESLRRLVRADELLAVSDPQRPGRDASRGRRGRARAPLAAGAMAVAGGQERLGHLVADAPAQASSGESHLRSHTVHGSTLLVTSMSSPQGSSARRVRTTASLSASTTCKVSSPSPSPIGPPRTTR